MSAAGIRFNGVGCMKLYQSKDWLRRRYVLQRKTVTEIAAECQVSAMTIQRYLEKFGLLRK